MHHNIVARFSIKTFTIFKPQKLLSSSFSEQYRINLLINQNIHIKQYFVWKKYSIKLALDLNFPFYNDVEQLYRICKVNIFNDVIALFLFPSIFFYIFLRKFCAREISETTRLIFMNFAIKKIMI